MSASYSSRIGADVDPDEEEEMLRVEHGEYEQDDDLFHRIERSHRTRPEPPLRAPQTPTPSRTFEADQIFLRPLSRYNKRMKGEVLEVSVEDTRCTVESLINEINKKEKGQYKIRHLFVGDGQGKYHRLQPRQSIVHYGVRNGSTLETCANPDLYLVLAEVHRLCEASLTDLKSDQDVSSAKYKHLDRSCWRLRFMRNWLIERETPMEGTPRELVAELVKHNLDNFGRPLSQHVADDMITRLEELRKWHHNAHGDGGFQGQNSVGGSIPYPYQDLVRIFTLYMESNVRAQDKHRWRHWRDAKDTVMGMWQRQESIDNLLKSKVRGIGNKTIPIIHAVINSRPGEALANYSQRLSQMSALQVAVPSEGITQHLVCSFGAPSRPIDVSTSRRPRCSPRTVARQTFTTINLIDESSVAPRASRKRLQPDVAVVNAQEPSPESKRQRQFDAAMARAGTSLGGVEANPIILD
eukprot:scaffold258889_cov35-Tisochrysis_lutea.AAC.2